MMLQPSPIKKPTINISELIVGFFIYFKVTPFHNTLYMANLVGGNIIAEIFKISTDFKSKLDDNYFYFN